MSNLATYSVPLTRQMVLTRGKCSDHKLCVKLNVVGRDIDEISLCLEMPHLEILSLSVNRISSLSSLRNCVRLKEVYLRDNKINDLNELRILNKATELTHLGMVGNPCELSAGTEYRASVLRLLPQIKNLDHIAVSESELQNALIQKPFVEYSPAPAVDGWESLNPRPATTMVRRRDREHEKGFITASIKTAKPKLLISSPPLAEQSSRICRPPEPPRAAHAVASHAPFVARGVATTAHAVVQYQHNNVLTAIMRLIPEMDNASLGILCHAIFELVTKRGAQK